MAVVSVPARKRLLFLVRYPHRMSPPPPQTRLLIKWVQQGERRGRVCFGVQRLDREFDHSPVSTAVVRLRLKCDDTNTENRFGLSAKRTSPFKSAGRRQFSRLLAAEVCASAVVMLDTPCSEVV